MKNKNFFILVCLLMIVVLFVACGNDNDVADPTAAPTQNPTVAPTVVPTTEPTQEPDPTEVPTPKPTLAPLTQEQLDVPFSDSLVGVEELYSQTFDDEYWNEDYDVYVQKADNMQVMDGMLFAPFQNGAYFKSWAALTLPFDLDFEVYEQIEISMDYMTDGKIAHKSLFAFFVTDQTKIPTKSGDGLWISPSCEGKVFFLGKTPVGTEPAKNEWGNPNGFAKVDTITAFAEMEKLTFVVRKDKITGYNTKPDGTLTKLFTAEIFDTEIVIYDGQGTEIYRGSNDAEYMRGLRFKIMLHEAATVIDNLVVKGY